MKLKRILFTIAILPSAFMAFASGNKPEGLRTDLLEHTERTWQNGHLSTLSVWEMNETIEPLQFAEIRSAYPTFSWIVPDDGMATFQISYRIIVSDNMDDADAGIGNVWDSGWTENRQSTSVGYSGTALDPSTCYFWRVRSITNTGGESAWSDVKAFRTADTLSDYAVSYYPQVKSMEYPISLSKIGNGNTVADFGKDAFGQLSVILDGNSASDSVVIHLGECMKDGQVDRNPGGTIRYHRYAIKPLEGRHTYRVKIKKDKRNTGPAAVLMPDYIGEVLPFRYCEVEGYNKPFKLSDIVRETVHYPFDDSASAFECDNDTLNQIWDLCKYSVKATTALGIYIDGDRERIPYEADALINQLCHYGVDKEYAIARRSHEHLLEHPTWPTEWIMQAVMIAWYDYLYTGDNRSLLANYDILKNRTLTVLRGKNGLISTTTGLQTAEFLKSIRFDGKIKDIVDWPHTGILGLTSGQGGEDDAFVYTDYNAVTNAYHYIVLKWMSMIAEAIGNQDDKVYYQKEADVFLARYNKMFFNIKARRYVDGDTTMHSALHSNMFPLAFGMVEPSETKAVLAFIRSRGMACSVYGSQFLLDAVYAGNDAHYGLELMTKTDDRSWYNMIRIGSTISLEAWDNQYKPNQDWNHAWGAAPANIIPRKLVGVEPLAPGCDLMRIKPQTASLRLVKAVVPTIKGAVEVGIENAPGEYRMQITIPANMECEVYLPLLAKKYAVTKNGRPIKMETHKNKKFLSAGILPSGTYTLSMRY